MLHYDPQHVSSSTLFILRKTNCITIASGIVTLCKQPYSMQVESGSLVVRSRTQPRKKKEYAVRNISLVFCPLLLYKYSILYVCNSKQISFV